MSDGVEGYCYRANWQLCDSFGRLLRGLSLLSALLQSVLSPTSSLSRCLCPRATCLRSTSGSVVVDGYLLLVRFRSIIRLIFFHSRLFT